MDQRRPVDGHAARAFMVALTTPPTDESRERYHAMRGRPTTRFVTAVEMGRPAAGRMTLLAGSWPTTPRVRRVLGRRGCTERPRARSPRARRRGRRTAAAPRGPDDGSTEPPDAGPAGRLTRRGRR